MVDPAAHLRHPPRGPSPDLRRQKIENRNTVEMRTPRDPPVETRVVDEYHGVRPLMTEEPVGARRQAQEMPQLAEHSHKADHRVLSQRIHERATGRFHMRAA